MMKPIAHTLIFAALALCITACSDDSPSDNNTSVDVGTDTSTADIYTDADAQTDPDTSDADALGTPDADASTDSGRDADTTCTPRTQCTADECGTVDDGCGGTLDCGVACNCIDGEPQGARCGECDVASYRCAPGETSLGTCDAPDLPVLDENSTEAECEAALVYVDPMASYGGEGERYAPYTNYGTAVQHASAGQILLLTSDAEYTSGLKIKDGVSHIGGFESGTWAFNAAAPSAVTKSGSRNPVIGVQANDITQQTVLAHFEVKTEAATSGNSTYGIVAVDADGLELQHVSITPGDAGDGRAGGRGEAGSNGGKGAAGSAALIAAVPRGGINSNCPEAIGGAGGEGALNPTQISGPPTAGSNSPRGGVGGAAGSSGSDADNAGKDGEDGMMVTETGSNGAGGVSGGQLVDNRWVPADDGESGGSGAHGIGGGGGGGSWHGPQYCTEADGDIKSYAGGKGGGGGAGGCGGEGGDGGRAGAASFGLLLIRSDITIVDTSITAGNAGAGGDGGGGGAGGIGNSGGQGTSGGEVDGTTCDPAIRADSMQYDYSSGTGGDGSDGAPGGYGGGGAGGVSYGIYCENAAPTLSASSTVSAGAAGAPGGGPGNPGAPGEAVDTKNCP